MRGALTPRQRYIQYVPLYEGIEPPSPSDVSMSRRLFFRTTPTPNAVLDYFTPHRLQTVKLVYVTSTFRGLDPI